MRHGKAHQEPFAQLDNCCTNNISLSVGIMPSGHIIAEHSIVSQMKAGRRRATWIFLINECVKEL